MKVLNIIFLILLVASGINFFEPQAITETGIKYIRVGVITLSIVISIPYLFDEDKGGFTFGIKLIAISIFFSMIMAYVSWSQNISQGFKATFPLMLWFSFFYFMRHKIPLNNIEQIIILFGIVYILLFFFQYTHSEVVYFGWQEEFREERGVTRINFPGGGMFFIFAFFAINKFTESFSNKKIFWGLISIICVIVIVLQVTRQSIALLVLIYTFHLFKRASIGKKILLVSIIGCISLLILNTDNDIVKGLKEVQEDTSSQGGDYIRVLSGTFFLKDFSPNTASAILGNGVPYYRPYEASSYGIYMQYLKDELNYYLDDVGIIAFYAMFGIFAILGYLLIFYKSFTIPLPRQYQYLKYYIWYIGATCLTSDGLYSHKFLAANIVALICYQMIYEECKIDEKMETIKLG